MLVMSINRVNPFLDTGGDHSAAAHASSHYVEHNGSHPAELRRV